MDAKLKPLKWIKHKHPAGGYAYRAGTMIGEFEIDPIHKSAFYKDDPAIIGKVSLCVFMGVFEYEKYNQKIICDTVDDAKATAFSIYQEKILSLFKDTK